MSAGTSLSAICLLSALLAGRGAAAQDAAAPPPAPAKDAPTLDELLGLKQESVETDSAAKEAARQNQQELERRLADAQIGDVLDRALGNMADSARLLDDQDPGLGTQRIQRDILARLDELIDLAKQMSSQQQAGSSSSSGSRSQRSQPQPGKQPRPAGGERRDTGNQDGQATEPPPGREGELNTLLEQTESEWGGLPQRLRDTLQQSRHASPSKLYKALSADYYQRLAEEGSP
jgi:hypothetical protein